MFGSQRKSGNAESKLPDDPYQSRTGPKFAIKLLSFNSFFFRSHLEKRSSRRTDDNNGETGSTLKSSTQVRASAEERKKYHHNHYPLNPPDKYSPFHFGIFVLTKKQSQRSIPLHLNIMLLEYLFFTGGDRRE